MSITFTHTCCLGHAALPAAPCLLTTASSRACRSSHCSACLLVALHSLQPFCSAVGYTRSTKGKGHIFLSMSLGIRQEHPQPCCNHGTAPRGKEMIWGCVSSVGAAFSKEMRVGATAQGLMPAVREDYSIFIYCHSYCHLSS